MAVLNLMLGVNLITFVGAGCRMLLIAQNGLYHFMSSKHWQKRYNIVFVSIFREASNLVMFLLKPHLRLLVCVSPASKTPTSHSRMK